VSAVLGVLLNPLGKHANGTEKGSMRNTTAMLHRTLPHLNFINHPQEFHENG
jgi:hypothetical protein